MTNSIIAERIKKLCKEKKVTVKITLEKCNINRNFIYDLEKNNQSPSCNILKKIADELECSTDYLLGRTDNPEINLNKK